MKRLRMPKRVSKKLILFGIPAGLIVVVAVYVWWSISSWSAYEQKYTEKQHDIQRSLESVWNMPADTVEQKQAKLARLASTNTEISNVGLDNCNQTLLLGWQRIIQANGDREKACRESVQSMQELSASLKPVIEFLQQGEAMAKIMAQAPSGAETTEADFNGQLNSWRATLDSVKGMGGSGEFETVKQATQGSIEGVVKAWEGVIAAHEAKDKARYTKAVQALAGAYDRLGDITKAHDERLNALIVEFKN